MGFDPAEAVTGHALISLDDEVLWLFHSGELRPGQGRRYRSGSGPPRAALRAPPGMRAALYSVLTTELRAPAFVSLRAALPFAEALPRTPRLRRGACAAGGPARTAAGRSPPLHSGASWRAKGHRSPLPLWKPPGVSDGVGRSFRTPSPPPRLLGPPRPRQGEGVLSSTSPLKTPNRSASASPAGRR
ncbi:hypothetical protein MBELCI_0002 [Limimaricola cinnabarinus LL-001]|uniref:Uncharacterized protein n=1 Tax=Limimaricola cinnabarinus LL-001 TaxID=1337093 RepID=U2YY14_9RHOB|nr:hypothetical protein MBELCI_0002 [Limimaricola cinnabarinus LL-001]